MVGTAKGQDGRELEELKGVTIPVVLNGPFTALEWKIDWLTAGKDALKSRLGQEAKDKLNEKLQPKVDELKEKLAPKREELENKARDALKGLFK